MASHRNIGMCLIHSIGGRLLMQEALTWTTTHILFKDSRFNAYNCDYYLFLIAKSRLLSQWKLTFYRNFYKCDFFFLFEKMQIKEELNISEKCGAVPPVWRLSSASVHAPSVAITIWTQEKGRLPGTGCQVQVTAVRRAKPSREVWRWSLTLSESTLAFISPRLVTAPHKCHLSFKWAPWQPDRRRHCELSFRTSSCVTSTSKPVRCTTVSLNSLKWMEVELT